MRQFSTTLFLLVSLLNTFAQKENFSYKFYGFVRGDMYYNSRANVEAVDGVFYIFPLDEEFDANGNDINKGYNGSFYSFATRFGLDVMGPQIWGAKSSAKIETDFGGFSNSATMLRIRQAYIHLGWKNNSFLVGQTWHPLWGEVAPDVINLNTGAPYQSFNRSPQFRYKHNIGNFTLTAATIWQLQYLSSGPKGKSAEYLKTEPTPELFAGVDYSSGNFLVGAGVDVLNLRPRKSATLNDKVYKVDEHITTTSIMAHARYKEGKWWVAAKSYLGQNLSHSSMLGGYGVSAQSDIDGSREYTPFTHTTSWINATYGAKWKGGIFIGYSKNLGTEKELYNKKVEMYGLGLDIDQLYSINLQTSYTIANMKLGLECGINTAYYGTTNLKSGKVENTHDVSNLRLAAICVYNF